MQCIMYTVQKKFGGGTTVCNVLCTLYKRNLVEELCNVHCTKEMWWRNYAMYTVQKNCGVGKILNLYLKLALLQDLTFYACFTVEIPSPLTGTNWCPLRDKIRYEYMILHRQDG